MRKGTDRENLGNTEQSCRKNIGVGKTRSATELLFFDYTR